MLGLFHEHQIDRTDNQQECEEMVPVEILSLKQNVGYHGEDTETDALLEHLQLHKVEGTAIALKPQTVGGHLTTILKKGDAP